MLKATLSVSLPSVGCQETRKRVSTVARALHAQNDINSTQRVGFYLVKQHLNPTRMRKMQSSPIGLTVQLVRTAGKHCS